MKNLKVLDGVISILVMVVIASAIYFYGALPEQVATHWNIDGEADGFGSKAMGAWLAPGLIVFMYLLFRVLPKLDPKKDNYQKFAKEYKYLQVLLITFFTLVHFVTNLYNLGYDLSVGLFIQLGIGIMFILLGFYIKNIKQNWFVGIRTPWTLSSEYVWKKTHLFGSKIFILSGIIFLLTPFLPAAYQVYSIWLIVILAFSIMFYSYFIFKNQNIQKTSTEQKTEEETKEEIE